MKKSPLMRKLMVLMMTLAVVFTYSVAPMNQSFAASAKKPAKVKSVKAVALSDSQTSIKVSWKKAKNAKKYQVYMATKKKGKFKKIATTKKRNYVKANLKNGKKYYFKVRAVNGKKKGAFSKVKSAKAKYVPKPAPAPGVKETPATIGASKTATLTTEIDMSKYPANQVVKVWVPVPQTDTVNGYQYITNEDFVADKATEARFTNKDGNRMLYLEWGKNVAPADRKATLSFTAQRFDVSRSNLKDDPTADLSNEAKEYVNKSSTYVNISDPIVKKYAAEAVKNVKDKNSTVEKTRAVYEWIIKNLARIDNTETLGNHVFVVEGCGYGDTVAILKDYEQFGIAGGHCTDLNSTFVALCRANGIAAREMFGIRLGNPGQEISDFQHCWAEFYLPGTGWVYADPGDVLKQIKPKETGKGKEIDLEKWAEAKASEQCKEWTEYFWGHVDNNRVVLSRGRDVTFEPAQAWGPCNTFGYPAAEVNGERNPKDFTDYNNFVYKITSQADRTVFVDAAYVKAAVDRKAANTVIAEVSWGPDAPEVMIPGAIHVNTDDLEDNTKDGDIQHWSYRGAEDNYKPLMDALADYGITEDTELICYAWDGKSAEAPRLAVAALMLGVKDVKVLDGGANAWPDKYGTAGASKPVPAASFGPDAPANPDYIVSTQQLVNDINSDTPELKLVSIRSYDEFIGDNSGYDYIDKAGEPKGAIWGRDTDDGSYLNNDGTVVGYDKLVDFIDDYDPEFTADKDENLTFYCGTGWRATIPFLIAYQEGKNNMKLWDDGWYVYSGANLEDASSVSGYPVQLGDSKVTAVTETTVGMLEAKYTKIGSLAPVSNSVKLFPGSTYDCGFEVKPSKPYALKYTSSDPTVATVEPSTGKVTVVPEAESGATATITAESFAVTGSTRSEEGKPMATASYEITVTRNFADLAMADWNKWGIADIDANADYIVDVREESAYNTAHIQGAVNAATDGNAIAEDSDAAKALDKAYTDSGEKRIVLICYGGNKYARSAMTYLYGKHPETDKSKITFLVGGNNKYKGTKIPTFYSLNVASDEWKSYGITQDEMTADDCIVDVRKAEDFEKGSIEGSINVPTDGSVITVGSDAAKGLDNAMNDSGNKRIILICYGGNTYAKRAMDYLYTAYPTVDKSKVTYLIGGYNNYKKPTA